MHTLNFYMYTLNFFSQQMLLHPLKHFPTNVAASIEMENNGSFEMRNLKSGQKWQKEVILAITIVHSDIGEPFYINVFLS